MTDEAAEGIGNGEPEGVWEIGWDGHREAQLRRWAGLTMAQKLEWLEEAHYFVLQIERARNKRGVAGVA